MSSCKAVTDHVPRRLLPLRLRDRAARQEKNRQGAAGADAVVRLHFDTAVQRFRAQAKVPSDVSF